MKRGNNNKVNFRLLVNGNPQTVFALHTDFGEPGACMTYNVQLTAGQTVSFENEHSTELYGKDHVTAYNSWFTGYLLFPL